MQRWVVLAVFLLSCAAPNGGRREPDAKLPLSYTVDQRDLFAPIVDTIAIQSIKGGRFSEAFLIRLPDRRTVLIFTDPEGGSTIVHIRISP